MIIEIKLETSDKVKVARMINRLNLEQSKNKYDLLSYKIDGKEQIKTN